MFKKLTALFISVLLVVSCIGTIGMPVAFADDGIVRIGMFSDSHNVPGGIQNAMNSIYSYFNYEVDGVALVGDIVYGDHGYVDAAGNKYSTGQGTDNYTATINGGSVTATVNGTDLYNGEEKLEIVNLYESFLNTSFKDTAATTTTMEQLLKSEKAVFAMGNHEMPLHANDKITTDKYKALFTEKTGLETQHDKVFGGYHFITAANDTYAGDYTGSEAWLKAQIAAALNEDANKPVFVILHQPIKDSFYNTSGSFGTYTEEFVSYLESNPRIVVVAGHIHQSGTDPKTIRQIKGGCTYVETSLLSGGNLASDPFVTEGNGRPTPSTSQALAMTINKNTNVVTIDRIDVSAGSPVKIGESWVLNIPEMISDTTSDTAYPYTNEYREANSKAPLFTGAVTATESNGAVSVSFPAATAASSAEDDMVQYYQIKVKDVDTAATVGTEVINSDYTAGNVKTTFTHTLETKLQPETSYSIEVSALNSWKKASAPLSCAITTDAYGADEEVDSDKYTLVKNVKRDNSNGDVHDWAIAGSYSIAAGDPLDAVYLNSADSHFVSFKFDVPVAGTYNAFVTAGVGGSINECPTIQITEIGGSETTATVTTVGIQTPTMTKWAEFTFPSAGTYTCKITDKNTSAGYSLSISRVALVLQGYGTGEGYSVQKNLTAKSAYEGLGNPSTASAGFSSSGYVSWEITPDFTGVYEISSYIGSTSDAPVSVYNAAHENCSDANLLSTKNVEIAGSTYGTCDWVEFGEIEMAAGTTYTVTLTYDKPSGASSTPYLTYIKAEWKSADVENISLTESFSTRDTSSSALATRGYGVYATEWISWDIFVPVDGNYDVSFYGGAQYDSEIGMNFSVAVGDMTLNAVAPWTGTSEVDKNSVSKSNAGWNTKETTAVGTMALKKGYYTMKFSNTSAGGIGTSPSTYLFDLTLTRSGDYDIAATGNEIAVKVAKADAAESSLGNYGALYNNNWVKWVIDIPADGNYKAVYNGGAQSADMNIMLAADAQALYKTIPTTGDGTGNAGWNTHKEVEVGTFALREGTHTLLIVNQNSTTNGSALGFEVTLTRTGDYAPDMLNTTYSAIAYDSKEAIALNSHVYYNTGAIYMVQNNYAAEYVVEVPAGNYDLSLFYGVQSSAGSGTFKLYIDDVDYGTMTLDNNSAGYMTATSWSDALASVRLAEGKHTIRIYKATGSNAFTFSKFKLTPITAPVAEIYAGEDAVIGSATINSIVEGAMTARVLLPEAMDGKPVKIFFAIYECDAASKTLVAVNSTEFTGSKNTAKAITVDGIEFKEGKTYASKIMVVDDTTNLKPYYTALAELTN